MKKRTARKPKPRKQESGKVHSFQARVDYVAKALKRGSWGQRFDACFEQHDGNHVIAAVMLRARRNEALKKAIMTAFDVTRWEDVPWHDQAEPFAGKSARAIGLEATAAREQGVSTFTELFQDPQKMLAEQS
jgi:hypothetical protein